MIGAKEFAIKRKVIEIKKKNPLLDKISMPSSMRSHEKDIKTIAGAFLDKLNNNGLSLPKGPDPKVIMLKHFPKMHKPHDSRTINPILEDSECNKSIAHKGIGENNLQSFFDLINSNIEGESEYNELEEHEHEHEEPKGFSDELANQITYKVFQNLKHYLEKDLEKPNRKIKVEISI